MYLALVVSIAVSSLASSSCSRNLISVCADFAINSVTRLRTLFENSLRELIRLFPINILVSGAPLAAIILIPVY